MRHYKKVINKDLIVMNKGERIAVITLLSIIAFLLAFSVFRPALHFSEEDDLAFHNLDSLIALRKAIPTPEPTPTSEPSPIPTPLATTSHKPAQPSKLAQPSTDTQPATTQKLTKDIPILELNTTDSLALVDLPQIGAVMASRIQRYRDRLGGYVSYDQLYEIKGMDSARYTTIRPYLLLDTTDIRKLEVNRDEFKTLLRHPYLDYDQVKAIVNYRERKGLIKDWAQLNDIVGEVNPLLRRYICY